LRSFRSIFFLLPALVLLWLPVFGQLEGNPANWCRQGFFPAESEEYQIARVRGEAKERAYFYDDTRDDCPAAKDCVLKSYLVPEDEVLVSRIYNSDWGCAWYSPKKGSPTVGWIPIGRLDLLPPGVNLLAQDWVGKWKYFDNSIAISKGVGGELAVKGAALWHGLGDNVHIGELDHKAKPTGSILKLGENETSEYDCKATLRLVGKYLVASDNMNCGGVNVTFSGVYRKTAK
jgi:hypothetical protein